MPRPSLTSEEVSAFRYQICDTAMRLFIDESYARVGLRALGAELGVTATALYRYFPGGKEEILATVRAEIYSRFARVLEEAASASTSPADRLRQQGTAYVRFAVEQPDQYRLMFDHAQEKEHPALAESSNRARDALYSLFDELVAEGLVAGDSCAATHAYWAALHGAVLLHTAQQLNLGINIDDLLSTIINSTLNRRY